MFGSSSFGNNNSFGGGGGGSTSFGSPFGANQGLNFGAQQPTQVPVGTTLRFQPLQGTDTVPKTANSSGPGTIQTRHQNICAMKEYESKSVDELRLEDYMANRKVGQPSQTSTLSSVINSPFGANAQPSTSQTGSIFGNTTQPTTTQASIFGTPSTSIFGGNTNQQTPSLFKPATQQTGSLFATPGTSQPSTSIFGGQTQTQTSSIFGQQTPNTSTSLFDTQNKPGGITNSPFQLGGQPFNTANNTSLGGTQNNTFGIFGNNNNTTGAQSSTTPFGATSNVNSPFSNSNSIFSNTNNQTSGSIFSNTLSQDANKSAFGQPQPSNSLFNFGANTNNNTSLNSTPAFGQPSKPTMFNSPFSTQPSMTQTGSLFGNTSQTANNQSSLFGVTNNAGQQASSLSGPTDSGVKQSPDMLLNRLKTLPYGGSSLFVSNNNSGLDLKTSPSFQKSNITKSAGKSDKPNTSAKPLANPSLFDELDDQPDDLKCALDIFMPKKSIKKLDLPPTSTYNKSPVAH